MKLGVIGSGYVGLCTAAGFAYLGHQVICVDTDETKVRKINSATPHIYEENLENMLKVVIENRNLKASTDAGSVADSEIIFLAVGTPSKTDGSTELQYIEQAARNIGTVISNKPDYCVVVVKSTVPPETTEKIIIPTLEKFSGKTAGENFGVCMNPEFLREGKAIEDFLHPDRIIIGETDKRAGDVLEKLYQGFNCPVKRTNLRTAELIKYASNAFLATKISFINEIGNLCKDMGIDVYEVADGMGLDRRISPHFLQAGIGFGGSCFRKDVESLVHKAQQKGHNLVILNASLDVNRSQPLKIVRLLEKKTGNLTNKNIAILGLSFKEDTDDIRDASSIPVINELLKKGARLKCYDPRASENMAKTFPHLEYAKSSSEALKGADACLILTAWNEFKLLKDENFSVMNKKIIIEGRRVLNKDNVTEFDGVCW